MRRNQNILNQRRRAAKKTAAANAAAQPSEPLVTTPKPESAAATATRQPVPRNRRQVTRNKIRTGGDVHLGTGGHRKPVISDSVLPPENDRDPPYGNEAEYKRLLTRSQKNRLFAPLGPPLICTDQQNVRINFCIPLWNRAANIRQILPNLQDIALQTNEQNVKVWIADFGSTDINLEEYIKQFTLSIEIVPLEPPFIIAKGLQIAAERMPKGEIVYFIDADAVMPVGIFDRLRKYVINGKQFYCPMVAFEQPDGKILLPKPGKDHGGKGHIGVFLDDLFRCNGWKDREHLTRIPIPGPGPMERTKWGGHDGHLYNKLRWDRLNCYRPRENDQWCRHHTRGHNQWYVDAGRKAAKKN